MHFPPHWTVKTFHPCTIYFIKKAWKKKRINWICIHTTVFIHVLLLLLLFISVITSCFFPRIRILVVLFLQPVNYNKPGWWFIRRLLQEKQVNICFVLKKKKFSTRNEQAIEFELYYTNISYLYRGDGRCAVVCSGVCVFCDYVVFMDPKCHVKHLYSICDLISYNKYSSSWFKGQRSVVCVCSFISFWDWKRDTYAWLTQIWHCF